MLRDDHPNADGFDLDDFCALDHALVSLGNGSFEGVTDEALAGLGRKRHVVLSVPSFLMLLEILRGSDLIAVVPKRLIQTSDGLRVLDPPVPIPGFQKVVAWHERTHHHPAHQWVRALLSTVCERTGQAGKTAISELLSRGHEVVAVARSPEKLPSSIPSVRDDLSSADRLAEIIKGADVVISAYGPSKDDPRFFSDVQYTDQLFDVTAFRRSPFSANSGH